MIVTLERQVSILNQNSSNEIVKIAHHAMDIKMAEDIRIIKISDISVIADYFIIANGSNAPQVEAIVDSVEYELGKAGYQAARIEGVKSSGWILMDYGDVIVHVFAKEDRLFYDLERVWRDGTTVSIEEL